MATFADMMESGKTPTGFQYSAVKIEHLVATEYSIVTIVVDNSGSTSAFTTQMEETIQRIMEACRKSPRAGNLLVRVIKFGTHLEEIHGFRPLSLIKEDTDYVGCLQLTMGYTALWMATHEAYSTMEAQAKTLAASSIACNGAVFVITDGEDTEKGVELSVIAALGQSLITGEAMDSFTPALINIGSNPRVASFGSALNMALLDIAHADAESLAKIGAFVSQSISSVSQSLGSGGGSVPLTI